MQEFAKARKSCEEKKAKKKLSREEINECHQKAFDAVIKDSLSFNIFNKNGMKEYIQFLKEVIHHQIEKLLLNILN